MTDMMSRQFTMHVICFFHLRWCQPHFWPLSHQPPELEICSNPLTDPESLVSIYKIVLWVTSLQR